MAGGYTSLGGGSRHRSAQEILCREATILSQKYGIPAKGISSRIAKYKINDYRLQIVICIPEQDFIMFKLDGKFEQIKNEIKFAGFKDDFEIVWEDPKNYV